MRLRTGPGPSPSSLLRVGPVRRLGAPCQRDRYNCCIVQVTSEDILDRNVRFLCVVETSWCATFCPPLHNVMMGPLQNAKIFESQRLEELLHHGLHELGHLCVQHLRSCFASGILGPGQASTLISRLRRCVLLARSCGADLEDHQTVFQTLWRVHRSWSLAAPTGFRAPVSHEIVLNVAVSAWLQDVPELSLLTLLSLHCLLRPQRPGNIDGAT